MPPSSASPPAGKAAAFDRVSSPVPWEHVISLATHIARAIRHDMDGFVYSLAVRRKSETVIIGLDLLPQDPRFGRSAYHYRCKGRWILRSAAVLTKAMRRVYSSGDPPARWLVTDNRHCWHFGPWSFRSPGDLLPPKAAHSLRWYPVSLAGVNSAFVARSLRTIPS